MHFAVKGIFNAVSVVCLLFPTFAGAGVGGGTGTGEQNRTYAIDHPMQGPASIYTPLLIRLAKAWPPPPGELPYPPPGENPVFLSRIETSGNEFFIGVEQSMRIEAPLARVERVLDDLDHYRELFPDFANIKVLERDGNRTITFWEQKVPLFFVPNVKYEMATLSSRLGTGARAYRSQLRGSKDLKSSDSLIVVEADGPTATRYSEYDFYDADWGMAKTVAPGRIWKDSLEAIYLSDLAVKYRSEHEGWTYGAVEEETRKTLKRYPVDAAMQAMKPFFLLRKPL